MQKLILFILFILILTTPLVTSADTDSAEKPIVYAVLMHADWCGSCKVLDPKITQARENNGLDEKNVLFITLDLTDDATSHQAAMMADVLEITELYESNAGKTGFMVLIDSKTGDPISRITKSLDAESISEQVLEAIKIVNS